MRTSPSTVIFDYGNVLCQSQPVADTAAMASILNLPLAQFREVYWRFRIPYDAAALSPIDYWNSVAQAASRTLAPSAISELIAIDSQSWSHPAPHMPQWARDLRAAGLRTAILSNMPVSVRDYVLGCPWLPEFDARVFSCDLGVCKPAEAMYQECLRALGAAARETLFLDDREPNVRAAEALGMHAILYTNASDAAREILSRFSLPVTFA